MARPLKLGLDYFNLDVDFFSDPKIQFISAKHGIKGEIIAIKLLCAIYRNSFFLSFDDDDKLVFAKNAGEGITLEDVDLVLFDLLKKDFFSKEVYENHKVLTSRGIQTRYFKASERRKEFYFDPKILLIEVNVNNNHKPSGINVDIKTTRCKQKSGNRNRKRNRKEIETETITTTIINDNNNSDNNNSQQETVLFPIEDEPEILHPLQKFIIEKCPNICKKMDKQLSYEEAAKLVEKFAGRKEALKQTLDNMENYKDLGKKSISVYLTILNWTRKDETNFNSRGSKHNFAKGAINPNQIAELREIAGAELGTSPGFYQEE